MTRIKSFSTNMSVSIQSKTANIKSIIAMIKQIETKTQIINDIVFQTKLLSFNASVEAARAGENGKGFSVVAEEIGKLAAMSGEAAKEIKHIIDASERQIGTMVTEMATDIANILKKGNLEFETGARMTEQVTSDFHKIIESVHAIAEEVQIIVQSSEEQHKGVHEISTAIHLLSAATQNISKQAGDTSTVSDHLSSESLKLEKSVSQLTSLVGENSDQSSQATSGPSHPTSRTESKHRAA